MQNKKYTKEFEVYYYQIDPFHQITPIYIVRVLEEVAVAHSGDVGYGLDRMKELGQGWMLSKWDIVIEKYPAWHDKILVETWSSGVDRYVATREFLIRDTEGNVMIRATSLWVLMDLVKRRPTRVSDEMKDSYGEIKEYVLDIKDEKLSGPVVPDIQEIFPVRKGDIDTNAHVNNASYIDWVLEVIPKEIIDRYTMVEIEVQYKKEAHFGQLIASVCEKHINEETIILEHKIGDESGVTEFALARTTWKKRSYHHAT